MFKALFNIIFNLLATLVQLVCLPLNTLIDNLLPDLAEKISYLTSKFPVVFQNLAWFVNILPTYTRTIFLFAINVIIVKYTIYMSVHAIIKVWNLFQKLKFW